MAYKNMYGAKETMPQTVPTGSYSPDAFEVFADNFDLSLLPNDGEVPLSPQSQHLNTSYINSVSSDYIPSTIFHDPEPMKQEKPWSSSENTVLYQHLQSPPQYQYPYPSPLSSPPRDSFVAHCNNTTFPPSPTPSVDHNTQFLNVSCIKQEFCGLLPPSPPESNGAPSPLCADIKTEPDTDSEDFIDIDSLLQNTLAALEPKKQDHQLLREYLQDTTFQRKHNLKPLALESLIGGWGTRGDIEPVISLALEHAKRDVQATCAALNIAPDPLLWTPTQAQSWLKSTLSQFQLAPIPNLEMVFPEDGAIIAHLTEEEFLRRAPQVGGTLHAQMEVWKVACCDGFNAYPMSPANGAGDLTPSMWQSNETVAGGSISDISDDEDEEMAPISLSSMMTATGPTPAVATTAAIPIASPIAVAGTSTATATPPTKTGRQGGSHIHLWQFLKELLGSPQTHGTAIRWLDRNTGVFKIEDSVRVARLWGRRKNRPAMNYDKLSRSIRQYYKKGIMKKTERSQRLVYQFCHPYSL